jgi:hypothetical protein
LPVTRRGWGVPSHQARRDSGASASASATPQFQCPSEPGRERAFLYPGATEIDGR